MPQDDLKQKKKNKAAADKAVKDLNSAVNRAPYEAARARLDASFPETNSSRKPLSTMSERYLRDASSQAAMNKRDTPLSATPQAQMSKY